MKDTITLWEEVCSDVPDELLIQSAKNYLHSSERWMPPPGVLKEEALKLGGLDNESDAAKAWDWVREWVWELDRNDDGVALKAYEEKWGRNEAAIEAVRVLGGAERFRNRNTEYDYQNRERFIKEYIKISKSKQFLQLGEGNTEIKKLAERMKIK